LPSDQTPEYKLWSRAVGLYKEYSPRIQSILDSPDVPNIEVKVSNEIQVPASTSGTTVTLSNQYFSQQTDDGAIIHEFTHAIHRCPRYDGETSWLIEGIADYVRDTLGFQSATSYPHFEKGKALSGYQTTAHLLFWLEKKNPGAVTLLSKRLIGNTYTRNSFQDLFNVPLDQLVTEYENMNS
jgi:hypothetical protein